MRNDGRGSGLPSQKIQHQQGRKRTACARSALSSRSLSDKATPRPSGPNGTVTGLALPAAAVVPWSTACAPVRMPTNYRVRPASYNHKVQPKLLECPSDVAAAPTSAIRRSNRMRSSAACWSTRRTRSLDSSSACAHDGRGNTKPFG